MQNRLGKAPRELWQVSPSKYEGTIGGVRRAEQAVIDSGRFTIADGYPDERHPVQGEDFPSVAFSKLYEVYTDPTYDMDSKERNLTLSFELVRFFFDYRRNRGTIKIKARALEAIAQTIPELARMVNYGLRKDSISAEAARELEQIAAVRR